MIRRATPEDDAALGRVLSDWIAETPWMPLLHTRDEDVGFIGHLREATELWCLSDASGFIARDGEEVRALYLAPAARGKGLGAALLDRVKHERDTLSLWTFQANLGAIGFYMAQGFSEIERTDGADNDEHLPDVRMIWERSRL